jgi:tetratricopeptide (TPR) repeat protein
VRAKTRHQLKQDAFSRATIEAAEKTANWSVEHRTTLIVSGIAIVIVLAIVFSGWFYFDKQNEKAGLNLTQAVRIMDAPLRPPGSPEQPDIATFTSAKERSQAARKQLQVIVDKYPHTHASDIARYLLGVNASNLGDTAAAEKDFQSVASRGNGDLAALAKFALASLYADNNRTKDAIALYQDLIKKPTVTVSKVTAQLQLASLYQNSNQPHEAKNVYEQVQKENPTTEAGQLATQKLAQLK